MQTHRYLPPSYFLWLTDRLEAVGGKQTAPSVHCYSNPSSGGRTISQSIIVLWIGYQIGSSYFSLLTADKGHLITLTLPWSRDAHRLISQRFLNRQGKYFTSKLFQCPIDMRHTSNQSTAFRRMRVQLLNRPAAGFPSYFHTIWSIHSKFGSFVQCERLDRTK